MDMDLQKLEAQLELAEPKERRALAGAAAKQASPDELARITRWLGHDQESVRFGAIEILAFAKFRPSLKYLAAVTVQKTGDEQVLAAQAVALMATASDRPALEKLARSWLGTPNHLLKDCGARLLVKLGVAGSPKQAVEAASRPVEPETPAIPGAGITAADAARRKEAIERTISISDDAESILVDALREKQPPGVRLDLINGLEWIGPESLARAAIRLLPRAEGTVVSLLARALTRHIASLPGKRATEVCDALDLAKRRLYGEQLVAEAVDECLRAASTHN